MDKKNNLLKAIEEGTFNLFGVDVMCYTLEDGRAAIEEKSMIELFEAMENPDVKIDQNELEQFAKWAKGIDNL